MRHSLCCGYVVRYTAAGVVSDVVQHVVVPVVDSGLCNRLYQQIADKVKLDISDDMMCAGIEEGGRDACQVPLLASLLQLCVRPTSHVAKSVFYLNSLRS